MPEILPSTPVTPRQRGLNWRFIVFGTLVGLLPPALVGLGFIVYLRTLAPVAPAGPTPLPVTPVAPVGALPTAHVGLALWARYDFGEQMGGTGFFLRLPDDTVVAVAAAHSLIPAWLRSVTLREQASLNFPAPREFALAEFYGPPGRPTNLRVMAGDYTLLVAPPAIAQTAPELILTPDPRGYPEVGERVRLVCATVALQPDGRCQMDATVTHVDLDGIWIALDANFDAVGSSGGPVLSLHTGHVIGTVSAGMLRGGDPQRLALNPIAAILQAALETRQPLPMPYRP